MKIVDTGISDVKIVHPVVHNDKRGFFFESYNARAFSAMCDHFVQCNHSLSKKNVLRGLHYQIIQPQGKLVRVISGEVFDVAVDIRQSSPTFGNWISRKLSAENKEMLWIPVGFAHGFLTLSKEAEFLYYTTDFYHPEGERCIRWDDPTLNIKWPIESLPLLSEKDQSGSLLDDAEVFT